MTYFSRDLLSAADVSTENSSTVQALRDRMSDSLCDYERSRGVAQVRRLSNLMFTFTLLAEMRSLAKQYWFDVKKGGRVPLHKLLSEMLEFVGT